MTEAHNTQHTHTHKQVIFNFACKDYYVKDFKGSDNVFQCLILVSYFKFYPSQASKICPTVSNSKSSANTVQTQTPNQLYWNHYPIS